MESLEPQAEDPPPSEKLPDRPSPNRQRRGPPDPMDSPVLLGRAEPERGAFRVGDMIWGKLKIRTWWPGKVLDTSSEIACETKVLVSFFGDAENVAWLEISKVIPFEEDLPRMLRQSTSVRFVRAVKDALVETENRLVSELFCRCTTNSILEGVGGNCSIPNYSPEQFCKRLLDAAKDASGVDMLEVVLLRCWGLALGRQIQPPTDLVKSDYPPSDAAAIDELQLEGKVNYSRVAKGPPIAEASNHKNKERSVAELIAGTDPEVAQPLENMDKVYTFHLSSTSQSSESPIPKTKGEKRRSFGVKNDIELDKPNSPQLSSEEQTKNDGILFKRERRSSGREHKRSKYLSPPYANEIDVRFSLPMTNAVEKNQIKVTDGSESSSVKSICHVSKKEDDDEIHVVSNGNQSSTIAALTILRSVAVNPLSPKLFRSTITHNDLFQKFRSSFCSGNANLQNELGRREQPFVQNSMDNTATTEIYTSKRNKKTSLASNEAPTIEGVDATVLIEADKILKRRKMRHGEAGSETTLIRENSNANGTKRVVFSTEKEMGKSSANSQIDLNRNAKDATDVGTPSIVTGIVACYPESISSQIKTSAVTKSPLPYVRKRLERMISKLTGFVPAESEVGSSNGLKPEMIDNLVADMDGLLKKVNRLLIGPPGNQ